MEIPNFLHPLEFPVRLGLDFDNTLVCYDRLFWQLARERGVIDESVPCCKEAIRDELRRRGWEATWTEMQGAAYGQRINEAAPFAGLREALASFRERGWSVCVISHKTRSPFAGPDCDLHAAARGWLDANGLLDEAATGLTPDRVFLELTKEDKLRRIAHERCDGFIDDLPELLLSPDFPAGVRRILFDPHRTSTPAEGLERLHDWRDAAALIEREPL